MAKIKYNKLLLNLGYKLFDLGCLLIRKAAVKKKADNKVYFYQITAFNKDGVVVHSEQKESPNKVVDLSWLNVPGATSYKFYGADVSEEKYCRIKAKPKYSKNYDDFYSNGVNLGDSVISK